MYGKTNAGASTGGSNSGIEMVKLWENASPSSSFSAQTVALDLSGYDAVVVEGSAAGSPTGKRAMSTYATVGRQGTLMSALTGSYWFTTSREFIVTTSAIAFQECGQWGWNDAGTVIKNINNSYCVPVLIWGVKGVK